MANSKSLKLKYSGKAKKYDEISKLFLTLQSKVKLMYSEKATNKFHYLPQGLEISSNFSGPLRIYELYKRKVNFSATGNDTFQLIVRTCVKSKKKHF